MEKEKLSSVVKRIKLKRQTKLICTLDEKWNDNAKIYKLLSMGVDGVEIKSELDKKIKEELIKKVRSFASDNQLFIPIIINLSYYNIHIDALSSQESGLNVNFNQKIYIINDISHIKNVCELTEIPTSSILVGEFGVDSADTSSLAPTQPDFIRPEPQLNFDNFEINDIIHINAGEIGLRIDKINGFFLECTCLNSGTITKNNSLSIEGKDHFNNNLIIADKSKLDKEIEEAAELDAEFIVMSLIQTPLEEILQIKQKIFELNSPMNVIIKIDNPKFISTIDDFLDPMNIGAIYFSRNDLNLKDSLSKVCFYQKTIVSKCSYMGVPVIISGTFIDTMRSLPNPIRAEISDLYNTILQGIDSLLLTAEIVSGLYPFEVIETINEICSSCEKRVDYSNLFLEILYKTKKPMKIVEAVASSTVKTSFNLQTPIIISITETGNASKCVAKYRPYCPVLTLTTKPQIAKSLSVVRGAFAVLYPDTSNLDKIIAYTNDFLLSSRLVNLNTNIVLLSGLNEKTTGTTDQMRVICITGDEAQI